MRNRPFSLVRMGLWAAAFTVLTPGPLCAQTYTVQSITAPGFGTLAAAALGTTTFRNTGSVSVVSGSGSYVTGTVTRGLVTVRCVDGSGSQRRCNNANNRARVTVATNGSTGGRGQTLSNFSATAGAGAALTGTTSGTSLDFVMSGWTATNQNRTFFVDVDMPVLGDNASLATSATSGFRVWAALNPTVPSTGLSSDASATIRRAMTISKVYDIVFGTIARPRSGSGTATVSLSVVTPETGTSDRSVGGTSPPGLVTSSFSGGLLTLKGETGTIFTLTAPTSMTMTGPGSLNVALTPSLSSGSYSMVAGGIGLGYNATIDVSSTTATGEYSGSFMVSIAYN